MANPPSPNLFPIEVMAFVQGSVSLRTLCGVQLSPVRFARNRASPLLDREIPLPVHGGYS